MAVNENHSLTRKLDFDIKSSDLQTLSSADALALFFAKLGWNTNNRIVQTADNLGITSDYLKKSIKCIELIADQEGLFQIYLFQLSALTQQAEREITRVFRNRAGNYLFVLAHDFYRLDFVLLDRSDFDASKKEVSLLQPTAPVAQPKSIHIKRLDSTNVDLRVLRRFTYTEQDPFAQYEKIRAAYDIAYWSEENFNNRALFSDHYLKERLRELPQWAEDVKSAYREIEKIYLNARSRVSGKEELIIRQELLCPTLKALGFSYKEGKDSKAAHSEPDYYLYDRKESKEPVAILLSYCWDRSLDAKDYQRDAQTPDENPGQVVVSLLEQKKSEWAIVTNGKIWRLYSAKTHSKATNYYEIDLEEVFALQTPRNLFDIFGLSSAVMPIQNF